MAMERKPPMRQAAAVRPGGRKGGMNPAEEAASKNMDINRRQSIEELTGGHIKKK